MDIVDGTWSVPQTTLDLVRLGVGILVIRWPHYQTEDDAPGECREQGAHELRIVIPDHKPNIWDRVSKSERQIQKVPRSIRSNVSQPRRNKALRLVDANLGLAKRNRSLSFRGP